MPSGYSPDGVMTSNNGAASGWSGTVSSLAAAYTGTRLVPNFFPGAAFNIEDLPTSFGGGSRHSSSSLPPPSTSCDTKTTLQVLKALVKIFSQKEVKTQFCKCRQIIITSNKQCHVQSDKKYFIFCTRTSTVDPRYDAASFFALGIGVQAGQMVNITFDFYHLFEHHL